jgi:2-(1,2-epoxy-1,2-dihydrophenyl)acetyl-CoA isomerase
MVTEVFPDDVFGDESARRVRTLAQGPALALRAVKEHVGRALSADLAECADAEVRWHGRLVGSPEHRAAVAAVAGQHSPGGGQG